VIPELLFRREYDAADLARKHPPHWFDRNKIAIHEALALPAPAGAVAVTRWQPGPRDERLPAAWPEVEIRADYFTYDSDPSSWHVNFADSHLFGGYASGLMAQDELQVVEHPILASVREALLDENLAAFTVEKGRPTPVLVRGAERRCAIDLAPNAERPQGLYGNVFSRTETAAVLRAVRPIDPPTTSHILAMEAPKHGGDRYTLATLRNVIETAVTGFAAARIETPGGEATIHTGFWGCGVYGGNRTLMTQLQVAAARIAGIKRVVFHAGRAPEVAAAALAMLAGFDSWAAAEGTEAKLLAQIEAQGLRWGSSDGN
jgi:hypothetical protein